MFSHYVGPTLTTWHSPAALLCAVQHTHTHTHTHPFNGPLSGTTWVSRYQKGKTNLDFTGARDSEWQWHQLGMRKSAPRSRQITMPAPHHSVFLQAGCSSCRPTNSVRALKAVQQSNELSCWPSHSSKHCWCGPCWDRQTDGRTHRFIDPCCAYYARSANNKVIIQSTVVVQHLTDLNAVA